MDKYVGKRLDGRYEIKEVIGVGGMAVVYKAYDNVEDRIVAIKILKEEFSTNEEFLRRFKNESKAISLLSHTNIVKVYDVSFGDLIQYIVMEYIDGITLKQYIEQQGSLPWKDAVHFIIQVLRGLQHAHDRGIVHRDIKPQNIMVLRDGTIKVTDFGIARFARSEQKTITDKAIGSVHYISPEQARGEVTDEKADVYSVGVILYEMITGQLPFQAESAVSVAIMQLQREPSLPTELNGSIPMGLEQITMHAMQKDSVRRYKSAAEMLCDLDAFRKDPSATFNYSYFVDNSPTKFVSTVDENTGKSDFVTDEPVEEDEEETKSPIIPILAGVAGAFVLALLVLGIVFLSSMCGGTGEVVECPSFVGMTYEEILENPEFDSYTINPIWSFDSDTEKGKVFKQDPQAGDKLKAKRNVTIYISQGQETVNVPDVYGMNASMAETQLKGAELQVVIEEMYHDDYAIGTVIKTSPARSTAVYPNDQVIMYVSLGPEAFNITLPSVVNMKQNEAVEYLESQGLVAEIVEADSTKPKGLVIAQSPSTDETKLVPLGSTVTLTVSTGVMNYEFDLSVDLPADYKYSTGMVSLWSEGQMLLESSTLDFAQANEYTFKVKTLEKSMELEVRLVGTDKSYDKYLLLEVDSSTGKYSIVKEYDYPKAEPDTDSSDTGASE